MESVTFKDGQEVSVVLGEGPPMKATWKIFGAGVAPILKLHESVEVNFGGSLDTEVTAIHVRP
jgi:hypothetical protein